MKKITLTFFKKILVFLTIIFLAGFTTQINAQSGKDSKGTDFWLTFPENYSGVANLYISGEDNATGNITIAGINYNQNFNVTVGNITTITLPSSVFLTSSTSIGNNGIHITSNREITVYGMNSRPYTSDAYLGLPTDALGTEYAIMSYQGGAGSQIGIVGTENSTTVSFNLKTNVGGYAAGTTYSVNLNSGQTFYLKASGGDLTGSTITSTKPVAVFSGNRCTNVPSNQYACDHLVEQMTPTNGWGKNFVTVPLKTRSGDTFRFLANTNGTQVSVNGGVVANLNKGQFFERIYNTSLNITATEPILVAQYSNGSSYDRANADPAMMLIPPFEQFLGAYTVNTPSSGFAYNFVNIVASNSTVGTIKLDGNIINPGLFSPIGSTGFSGAQVNLSIGTHNLSSNGLPFGAFVYGFNNYDSYGYPAGASFSPIATVNSVSVSPKTGSNTVGISSCFSATVLDQYGDPVVGVRVDFSISGANSANSGFANTDANGLATFCYAANNVGDDAIVASIGTLSDTASFTWNPLLVAPEVVCPENIVVNSFDGQSGAIVNFTASETVGNPASEITYSLESGTFFPVGETDVTVIATNSVGTSSCSFTVTVLDTVAPIALAKDITVSLDANGNATITPQDINNGSSDNSGNLTLSIDQNTFDCEDLGAEQSAEYAIQVDGKNDYIDLGNFGNTLVNSSKITAQVWLNPYKIAPNSIQSLFEANIDGRNYFSIETNGNNKIDFYVSGAAIRTNTDVLQVGEWINLTAVFDGTKPNGERLQLYINGQRIVNPNKFFNGTNQPSLSGNLPNFYLGSQGGTSQFATVTYDEVRVWDRALSEQEITGNWNKTVVGNEQGLIAYYSFEDGPGNSTVTELTGTQGQANLSNMDPNTVWVTGADGLSKGGSGAQVTLTVEDLAGNTATTSAIVTVVDNISPKIIAPANISVFATSADGAVVNYTSPVGTDNCAVTTVLTEGLADGATFPLGITTVTYTATDTSGNATVASFNVEVVGIAPEIVVPTNISVSNDAGICGAVVNYTATETVGIPASTITYDIQPGSLFTIGSATVTATATNAIGTSTKTFTVNVNDNEAPTAIAKDISIDLDANGNASITPEMIDNGSFDNCGIESILLAGSGVLNATTNEGYNLVLQAPPGSVIDGITFASYGTPMNNEGTFTIGSCHANNSLSIVENYALGKNSVTIPAVNSLFGDPCGGTYKRLYVTATYSAEATTKDFTCANVGSNQVTLLVTDINGNIATATANVTVNDITVPSVVTKNISVNLDANGTASITPEMINDGSSDACGIASYSLDNDAFTCENVGENQVTLTVTDVNGNKASLAATVTVKDGTAPTVITQSYSITLANGVANITPSDIDGGTFDNCDFTLSIDKDSFSCEDIGDHVVTLIAVDASGNRSSNSAIVSVLGDVPTISINDFNAVQTQKKNTIFLGFGPQSVNLSTVVSGGSGFTYEWTTSSGEVVSNEANPSINPTVSTTYNVTVTNSNGCTASTSIYICVIDARAFDKKGRDTGKVIVCHHTNGKKGTKHVEISISANAVMTHLTQHGVGTDHADKLGACNAECVTNSNAKANTKDKLIISSIEDNLSIYPNPSNGIFDVKLTAVNLQTELYLFDTTGKLIQHKSVSKENSSENIITMGNYNLASGFYLLKIITENESVTKKLIIEKSK